MTTFCTLCSPSWPKFIAVLRCLLPLPHPQMCGAFSLMWCLKKKAIGAYINFLLAVGSQFCGGNITTNKTVSCQTLRWSQATPLFRGTNTCNILIFHTPQKNLCFYGEWPERSGFAGCEQRILDFNLQADGPLNKTPCTAGTSVTICDPQTLRILKIQLWGSILS